MKTYFGIVGAKFSAFLIAGALVSSLPRDALATDLAVMANSTGSNVAAFPKLISAACYVSGAALVGTGVMKVKQHVDNPQTPLREGLVRLAAGGVLVAAPAMTAVMTNTSGVETAGPEFSTFGEIEF